MKTERITPPETAAVSLADAKAHLRIEADWTDEDAYIATLLEVATASVENFTGRRGKGTRTLS